MRKANASVKPKKLYFVWDRDGQYFEQYDNIKDCARSTPTEVFEATPKSIGYYAQKTSFGKVKAPKLVKRGPGRPRKATS